MQYEIQFYISYGIDIYVITVDMMRYGATYVSWRLARGRLLHLPKGLVAAAEVRQLRGALLRRVSHALASNYIYHTNYLLYLSLSYLLLYHTIPYDTILSSIMFSYVSLRQL